MYAVLELHKEVLQGLQTVDAFSQDMFLPEEIDFHLNKQQDSFISEMLDEGFADRQLRLDYVQDIIVSSKTLPVYISSGAHYYEPGAVVSYLPGNYKHLLSTRVKVREGVDCSELEETTEDITYYITSVALNTNLSTGSYYSRVQFIRINEDQSEDILVDLKNSAVEESDDIKDIMEMLVFEANKESNTVEYYLGKYPDTIRQGNIIADNVIQILIPTNTVTYKIITYKTDGSEDVDSGSTALIAKTTKTWDATILSEAAPAERTSAVNLDSKEKDERTQNVFYASKSIEPHINLADGIISTYYTNFLPEEIYIDYIRNPQLISYSESKGCELSNSAARLIANRVIEYLKLVI